MPAASYLWLLPTVQVIPDADSVLFLHADGQSLEISDPGKLVSELILTFDGNTRTSVCYENPLAELVIAQLSEQGWLSSLESPLSSIVQENACLSREFTYLAHQFPVFPDRRLSRIQSKTALIVGTGGIGTAVSFALGASGIKQLIVVDPDNIEVSNLNRQFLFESKHVGSAKVKVLAESITSRFPSTFIDPIQSDFDASGVAESLVPRADLVIVCGESRILFREPGICSSVPLMFAGYEGICGVVGPLLDSECGTVCWSCLVEKHGPQQIAELEAATLKRPSQWNPSGACINLAVGSLASTLAIRFLSQDRYPDDLWGIRLRVSMRDLTITRSVCHPNRCCHSRDNFNDHRSRSSD